MTLRQVGTQPLDLVDELAQQRLELRLGVARAATRRESAGQTSLARGTTPGGPAAATARSPRHAAPRAGAACRGAADPSTSGQAPRARPATAPGRLAGPAPTS